MFGYVNANWKELDDAQKDRYQSVYCGICRRIREQSGQIARLGLSYDMAFLALLLMSLYEPEETSGPNACMLRRRLPAPMPACSIPSKNARGWIMTASAMLRI